MDEHSAADTIARAFRRKFMRKQVHRQVLLDRIELEEALCPGVVRLVLFVLLFMLLIIANTSNGITSEHKRHITTLMGDTLDLDHFLSIKSLDGVRDYLPLLSKRLKQFSMSSSSRFQDQELTAIQILGPRTTFNAPWQVLGLNPAVGRGDFTLSAWVDTLPSARPRENLLRMPLATAPSLSCWAWSHPAQLRFGAHDFYSTEEEPEEWEEVVEVGEPLPPGLTHEVVVLRNGTLTFFRNAEPIASHTLRRDMTQCLTPGVFEVGDRGVAMSSVKFYPRALLAGEVPSLSRTPPRCRSAIAGIFGGNTADNEPWHLESVLSGQTSAAGSEQLLLRQVKEIFFGGQPLSELATGTVLEHVELDTTEAIKVAIQGGTNQVSGAVEATKLGSSVDSVVEIATTKQLSDPPYIDQLYLPDSAPPTVHWQEDPALLPPQRLAEWEAAGRPSNLSAVLTEEWRGGELGEYWSFFEDPVYGARLEPEVNPDRRVDPPLTNEGPEWGEEVQGLSFSYWLQPIDASKMFWCDVSFRRGGEAEAEGFVDHIQLTNYGHVLWLDFRRQWGDERYGPWKFLTYLDPDSGKLEEKYIFTKYVNKPGPAAWRHVLCTVDFVSRSVDLYFDGRLFANSLIRDEGNPFDIKYAPFPQSWTPQVLSRLRLHTFSGTLPEWGGCKVAQARVYPRVLGEAEVLRLQNSAAWAGGGRVKQCADAASDSDFVDTPEVDDRLRSCAWYHQTRKTNPEVCLSARARAMCPMSCQGRRACYDGSMAPPREEGGEEAPGAGEAAVHTVFSHIRHIQPANRSVLCPALGVERGELLRECLRDRAASEVPAHEYDFPGSFIFDRIQRADLRDCGQLLAAVDAEHCGWNASWVPQFLAEFEARKEMSISLWIRPKDRSLGMPKNFWPSFHLYSRLHRPYTLLEGSESFPMFEPLWRFFFNAAGQRNDRLLVVSNHIPYAAQWTMFHFQVKRREGGGGWEACGALNAMKATCVELEDEQGGYNLRDGLGWPEEFLQGVEFTTEMLVSPIEVQAKAFTPAQIQQRYYRRYARMERILGPAEFQGEQAAHTVRNFDSRVALVTPPLIFQARAQAVPCSQRTTRTVLASQLRVVRASHCQAEGECAVQSAEEMATCLGPESHELYFGLKPFKFQGSTGICDFLYTLADTDVVVRERNIFPTYTFLDWQTTRFVVLVVAHMPNNGMSTLLELHGKTQGFAVQTSVNFFHYGYRYESAHGQTLVEFGLIFGVLALILLLNLLLLLKAHREHRHWHLPYDRASMLGMFFGVLQVALVGAFSVMALVDLLESEEQASSVVGKLSAVQFERPDISFDDKLAAFFAAAEELYTALDAENFKTAFAFTVMVLMLLRIIQATAAHPRTGVLTATLAKGLSDLYHFAIQFMIFFFFFSYAASWLFGDSREDFRDLAMSMETQFNVLLGNLPKDFSTNDWLIIYVVLCSITMYMLMLNFLLALVVDAYMSVREEIVRNEAENEFLNDIALTLWGWYKAQREGWPSLRAVAHLLRTRIASRQVSPRHLVIQGIGYSEARSLVEHYFQMKALAAGHSSSTLRLSKGYYN